LKRLALTFDDGPSEWTPAVLELLREHGARATFFVIGARVRESPKMLGKIVEAGHEIGSHTLTHPRLTELSDEEVRAEVAAGAAAVDHVLGAHAPLFRAPGHHTDERVDAIIGGLGLQTVFADVDPEDWKPEMTSHAIFSHVLANVRDEAIVDLHDGYPPGPTRSRDDCTPTVEALGHLLPCLVKEHYELVTVSELRGDGLGV
jgi:peptidoglycan-N-acetylglucosamine deacetylase